jgi:hypothetical protein
MPQLFEDITFFLALHPYLGLTGIGKAADCNSKNGRHQGCIGMLEYCEHYQSLKCGAELE